MRRVHHPGRQSLTVRGTGLGSLKDHSVLGVIRTANTDVREAQWPPCSLVCRRYIEVGVRFDSLVLGLDSYGRGQAASMTSYPSGSHLPAGSEERLLEKRTLLNSCWLQIPRQDTAPPISPSTRVHMSYNHYCCRQGVCLPGCLHLMQLGMYSWKSWKC